MYQSPVRSATAGTAKTALALIAIFSLLLSLFAIARPVIAFDDVAGPAVTPTVQPGNPECPAGTTEIKFEGSALTEGSELTATIVDSDGIERDVTVTITNVNVAAGTFDFEVEGGLALVVIAKGGRNGNVYDYRPLGGAAHDDGLVTPTNPNNQTPFGISHISFCVIPIVASIDVEKTGPAQSKVGDPADYTVTITNDGDIELFIQSVDDTLAGDLTAAVVAQCESLLVDEVCVFNYSYTVQEGDDDQLVNVVTVTATTGAAGTGTSVNDDGTATVDLFQPGITVDKTGPATAEVGDVITYTVTITNTSSDDSPNLVIDTVTDTLVGDLTAEAILTCGELEPTEVCVLTYDYTVTADSPDPIDNTVTVETNPDGFPNDIDDSDSHQVDVVEQLGSITINKVIECEECETRTPGYYFNTAGSHDDVTNALLAEFAALDGGADGSLVEVNIDGMWYTFATAQDVRDFLDADRDGVDDGFALDGETGLSRDGQLLRQYLATQLNILLNGDECDLASRELGDQTVADILLEAEAALAADDEAAEVAAIEKLTAINESDDAEENPLTCGTDTEGTPVDGFHFDLYTEADYPDGAPLDSGITADGGTLTFSDLPLGTYVIVETGNDAGLDCEVVAVSEGGTLNPDGSITVTIDENNPNVTLTVTNECDRPDDEDEFGDIEIRKDANDPDESFFFSASWDGDGFTLMDGDAEFSGDLPAGDEFTVTETLTEAQIAAGWSLDNIDCGDAAVTVEGSSVTITVVANETIVCTFTNELEEEDEEGILEIDKFYCPADDDGTQFIVSDPAPLQSARIQGEDEEGVGCSVGDATFTIENNDTGEIWENVSVGDDGQIELDLPAGNYTITETSTDEDPAPSATFTIEDGAITAVIVINFEGEDEEEGQIKIIKLFCEADEDSVTFTIEGGNQLPPSLDNCELGDAAFQLNDGETFTIGDDGIWFASMPVGSYTLTEVVPNQATSPSFDVELGEITTIIVVNNEGEDDEDEETVQVSIMKHLCADVATVAEFEAIEAAAAEENPDNAFAPLVATVLACPTIVLTGDVPMEGAVSGGEVDFEFSVLDADGNQLLSEDGALMNAELCESMVGLDLDGDPEVDACLDVSHYTFEVVDGLVVITETDAPEGHRLGTIRFTPGSDDADALVGDIEDVERTGVIVLDTTADADDAVMIHAYNFVLEDEQGGGGTGPDNTDTGNTPRDGTAGGNPLPNTASSPIPTGSVPAALLALLMLSGLGAAGYAMATEARRRR